MELSIEQITIEDGVLIHSQFVKNTITADEDGADYEYDFHGFMSNLDQIQNTILRLYGEQGFKEALTYYANGALGVLSLGVVEFEKESELLQKIRLLQNSSGPKYQSQPTLINLEVSKKGNPEIPSDSIFLLTGMLEALPNNDDLNLLKMLSKYQHPVQNEWKEAVLQQLSFLEPSQIQFYFFQTLNKLMAVSESGFFCFHVSDTEVPQMIYPCSEVQELTNRLFSKYGHIPQSYPLKQSILFEVEFNDLAKRETNQNIKDYYLLFNLESCKFESKELKF